MAIWNFITQFSEKHQTLLSYIYCRFHENANKNVPILKNKDYQFLFILSLDYRLISDYNILKVSDTIFILLYMKPYFKDNGLLQNIHKFNNFGIYKIILFPSIIDFLCNDTKVTVKYLPFITVWVILNNIMQN